VTVSIGVAAFEERLELSFDEVLALADATMYAAKRAGRDRVFTLDMSGNPVDLTGDPAVSSAR
jgi:PleD family two-component response regulator